MPLLFRECRWNSSYKSIISFHFLIQNRTGDFGVPFSYLRRSALQPLPQCTASASAVHCIFSHKLLRDKTPFWGISSSMLFLLSLVFS